MLRHTFTSLAIAGLAATSAGCPAPEDPMADDTSAETSVSSDSDTDPSATTTSGEPGWVELGWGVDSFTPLVDGGDFEIVYGTQGAAMFPMPVRVGDIPMPADPSDFTDPMAPKMNLELDIEGHNDGFGGHFKRIANYSMMFEPLGADSYEFLYVAIILPDDKDPLELEGLPAHLWVEITPFEREPIVTELDLVVTVGDVPG